VHPDIYRDLARQHHDDLDREAARASLAAKLRRDCDMDPVSSPVAVQGAPSHGVARWNSIRLSILGHTHRALLAMEGRVARALADTPVRDNTP
jgi:hypothetical protein